MILRFQTKLDRNGNKRQIEYNTETNTAKYGYCLFVDSEAVTITPTEYKKMRDNFIKNHCWMQPND